jgi:hypothetical protein
MNNELKIMWKEAVMASFAAVISQQLLNSQENHRSLSQNTQSLDKDSYLEHPENY